ncbi:uncharacterized protein LOC135075642 [Ostrinia nubilalis]|uniref:uncharacterized protein LOC135075642 n=1 Tax=Ostrinia nubilalis TaxID=29057 RepID=UPI003082575E
MAALHVATLLFVVGAGAFTADPINWKLPAEQVPAGQGDGGFVPHGAVGVLRGAAICFYGFMGFDTISATAEEVKEPRRAIPLAILSVFGLALVAYASVSIVVTMMVPYYDLDPMMAVVAAFSFVGWEWARWIVTVGAVFGIAASLCGALFPLPRLLYSMAADGLGVSLLARVSNGRVPVVACLLPAAFIAVLAGCVPLEQLVRALCAGALLAHASAAVALLCLRYRSERVSEAAPSTLRQLVGRGDKAPTQATSFLVYILMLLFACASAAAALVWRLAARRGAALAVLNVAALLLLTAVALQPRAQKPTTHFTTPLFPLVPLLSIYVNIHLMIFISLKTWLRLIVWILIGIPLYILFLCCYKSPEENNLEENIKQFSYANKNGKTPIQIVVESPTPPGTMDRSSNSAGDHIQAKDSNKDDIEMQETLSHNEIVPYATQEIVLQHAAVVENNEEREAKIIDMLDRVLQAEEDSYGEIISLKDPIDEETVGAVGENVIHRKSLSELSDAGSDASLGNQVLSKYDVIAQVHREDLPIVTEEKADTGEADILDNNNEEDEGNAPIEYIDSETNSQTDESGYSDTIEKNTLNDSSEDIKDAPYIPTPPPFDANFFANQTFPVIPPFQKSYTVPKRPSKNKAFEELEENKPRESVQSNGSQGDGTIIFGSDRQINFMSKLSNIFQGKINTLNDTEDKRRRSNSTGNVIQNTEFSVSRERPAIFFDLKKEILAAQKLRAASSEEPEAKQPPEAAEEAASEEEEERDISMSRNDLKSKLESIYANGGPQLFKPRLMKSNPPTPEEAYQTDTSSTESIAKLPKIDKNDTLKRQKDKFSAVLNSFRLSINSDDAV